MNDGENAFDFICSQAKRRKAPDHIENNKLIHRAHAGEFAAQQELIIRHQGLVTQRVNKYGTPPGLDPEDLQQEGTFGLIRAIRNFKTELGFKFSTFAAPVIDQFIDRAVKQTSDLVKKPSELQVKLVKVQRKWSQFISDSGRPPSQAELSALCDLSLAELDKCKQLFMESVSLDTAIGDTDDFCLGDTLACTRELPSQSVDESADKELVRQWLAQLDSKDKFFIESRFGLLDGDPKTRSQLAQKFAVSELEVQRWEKRVLARIESLAKLEALNKEYARDPRRSAAEWKTQPQSHKRTPKRPGKNTVVAFQRAENNPKSARIRCLGPLGSSLRRCIAVI